MLDLGLAVQDLQQVWGRPWGRQAAIRTLAAAVALCGEAVHILGKDAAAESRAMWRARVDADEEKGAKGAHSFSKVPVCPAVPVRKGAGGASRQDLLEA
jgi:hypothetical protein